MSQVWKDAQDTVAFLKHLLMLRKNIANIFLNEVFRMYISSTTLHVTGGAETRVPKESPVI